jgi:hypothetical protein
LIDLTKQWSNTPNLNNLIWWAGLAGGDKSMSDFLRFTQDLIALRRSHALAAEAVILFPFFLGNTNRPNSLKRHPRPISRNATLSCNRVFR